MKSSLMRFNIMWYAMFIHFALVIVIMIMYIVTIAFILIMIALTVTAMVLTKFTAIPWAKNEMPNVILKIVALVVAILGVLGAAANLVIMIQVLTTPVSVAPLLIVFTFAYLAIEFLFYLSFVLLFIKAAQLDKKFPGVMGGECLLYNNDEEGQRNTSTGNPRGQSGRNG